MNEFSDTDVRNAVGFIPKVSLELRFSEAEAAKFDRWLEKHDAEQRASALERAALDAEEIFAIGEKMRNEISDADWARFKASAITEVAHHSSTDTSCVPGWLRDLAKVERGKA